MQDKLLFFDLETTGTDNNKHMVTQIAAEWWVDGKKEDEFYVKLAALPSADTAISLEALKVTNQGLKDTLTEGVPEGEGLIQFVDWLLKLDTKNSTLCGHNVHFDLGFIKNLLAKYRLEKWEQIISYRMEDTCALARTLQRAGILPEGSIALGKLAESLGIFPSKEESLHNAKTDVKITRKVYFKLLNTLKKLSEV